MGGGLAPRTEGPRSCSARPPGLRPPRGLFSPWPAPGWSSSVSSRPPSSFSVTAFRAPGEGSSRGGGVSKAPSLPWGWGLSLEGRGFEGSVLETIRKAGCPPGGQATAERDPGDPERQLSGHCLRSCHCGSHGRAKPGSLPFSSTHVPGVRAAAVLGTRPASPGVPWVPVPSQGPVLVTTGGRESALWHMTRGTPTPGLGRPPQGPWRCGRHLLWAGLGGPGPLPRAPSPLTPGPGAAPPPPSSSRSLPAAGSPH